MTTAAAESVAFWTAPRDDRAQWLAVYLASAEAAYRIPLVLALRPLWPFGSVLEVGCHCGPVLKSLRAAFGPFPYVGLDVNGVALDYGRRAAERDGYGDAAQWVLGSVLDPDALRWPDQAFDLVVSASVLAHVSPDDLPTALAAMARLAKRAVLLHEPDAVRHDGLFHQWAHDYAAAWQVPGFTLTERDGVRVATRR